MNQSLTNMAGRDLGQYQLTALVGTGGMSAVYRANQASLNRDVAVKVMSPSFAADPTYIERFKLEAKTAASLEHNNIVPVYDYGTDGDVSYIVMRLLTGGTLGERVEARVKSGGRLPSGGEAVTLLNEMAKALIHAHSRGIIHRDIKASNIMFDAQGDPYVVDFGIARAVHSNVSLTAENITMGTPTYMAPEQWRDEPLTPATDQYSLGVLMMYMLTGRLPLYASTSAALMQKHLNNTPPMVHELRGDLPERAGEVIARALSKQADDRYTTVMAFAEEFEAAMRGAPGKPTDFFRFVLPGKEATAANYLAPTVDTPAKATVPNQAASPQPMPNVENNTPPPARPTPARPASPPRKGRPLGWIAGLSVIGLIVVGGFTAALLSLFEPPANETAVPSTAESPSTDDNTVGGIRINPSPGAVGAGVVPTQITLESPGGNVAVSGDGDVLFSQLQIVVRDVAITPLGVVVSAHADGRIRMWMDGTGGEPTVLQQHRGVVNDVDISADGRVMVSGGDDNTVRVWDAQSGTYRGVLAGHTNAVRGVAASPDGTRAASASEDGSVRLWDVDGGSQLMTLIDGNVRFFTVAFSPDGSLLAAGDNGGNIILWNTETGNRQQTLSGHSESVRSVAFSPDGAQLVSSSTDNTVRLWDISSGANTATLRGHDNDVWRVAFSPDGAQVASGGRDNNLRIWEVATGNPLQTYTGHVGWVLGVAYSPDGALITSGGGDGVVRLWQAVD